MRMVSSTNFKVWVISPIVRTFGVLVALFCHIFISACVIFIPAILISNVALADKPRNEPPSSILGYIPSLGDFDPVLVPIIQPIRAALQDMKGGPLTKSAREQLQLSITRNVALRPQLVRGLVDESDFFMGYAQELLGQETEALKSYDDSLESRANNHLAAFRKAVLLKNAQQYDLAVRELSELNWDSQPRKHEVYYTWGQCLLALNRVAEAQKVLVEARKSEPTYLPVVKLLVATRANLIDEQAAKRHPLEVKKLAEDLTYLTSRDPSDRDSSLMLAKLLIKKSDPIVGGNELVEAEQIADRLAQQSNYSDDSAVRLLFDAQLKKGDVKAAERTVTRGLSSNPSSQMLMDAQKQLEIQRAGAAAAL
jgi:tetratricopeptide (TPR) repeat protein